MYQKVMSYIIVFELLVMIVGVTEARAQTGSGGVYVTWPAVAAICAVLGLVGAFIGILRKADQDRVYDRLQIMKESLDEIKRDLKTHIKDHEA